MMVVVMMVVLLSFFSLSFPRLARVFCGALYENILGQFLARVAIAGGRRSLLSFCTRFLQEHCFL